MSKPTRDDPITDAEKEEAMFQRFVRRLDEMRQSAVDGAETAAFAAADVAGNAAAKVGLAAGAVGRVAGDAAGAVGRVAGDAAGAVGRVAGDADGAVGRVAGDIADYVNNATYYVGKVVESRRSSPPKEIAQLLFRVPESLRDDVKRLALDEKRQMDELLTEAVVDLLIKKRGRLPKAIEQVRVEQTE